MRRKINEWHRLGALSRRVPGDMKTFSLGRTVAITDNALHKKLRGSGNIDPPAQQTRTAKGRRPTMTRFDGELSPPFEIVEPAEWRAPIIFNSPHSGSVYPDEFLNASRIDLPTLRRSEDSFMDELIADLCARGFPVVRVNFPRSYVDVNREPYELDPRMFAGRLPSFRQHPLDAGRRRPRHHSARGRRRAGNLPRAAVGRRRADADRDALQALSPRAAAADQPGAPDLRHGRRGRLPFDAVDRRVARRAARGRTS